MSYAGVERTYHNPCAPDSHDWNPRGDCHRCGIYRDHMIDEAVRTIKEFYWALTPEQKIKLETFVKDDL